MNLPCWDVEMVCNSVEALIQPSDGNLFLPSAVRQQSLAFDEPIDAFLPQLGVFIHLHSLILNLCSRSTRAPKPSVPRGSSTMLLL